jgi:hypothetical protein
MIERPPLLGEVSANFLRIEGVTWSAQRILTAVNIGFQDRSRYFSIQVAPQLSSQRHTLYAQKLALISSTSGGRSVGIVRLRTTSHGVFF